MSTWCCLAVTMTVARRRLLKGRDILAFVPLEETKQAGGNSIGTRRP